MKRLALFALAALALGCATQGGGVTYPITINGQKVLVNSASVLLMESAQQCNAAAQVEYNLSVEVCTGQLNSLIPIQTGQANQGISLLCQAFGYTNSSNQLMVPSTAGLGNCATATPMPTAAPAPGM